MINGYLSQFLDTGWMNDAELYYKGKIYFTECFHDGDQYVVTVASWHVKKVTNTEYDDDPTPEEKDKWVIVYKDSSPAEDEAREKFLKAPFFEGKSFWEIEPEVEWLEHV